MDAITTAEEMANEVSDNIVEAFEDMNKNIDHSVEGMEHMVTMAQSFADIMDLVGLSNLGLDKSILVDIKKAQADVNKDIVAV
jgi:hypothetical protein